MCPPLFLILSPFFCCGTETPVEELKLRVSIPVINFQHSDTEDQSTDDNSKYSKPPSPCDFDEPGCNGARNLVKY
jgi:hypothetical protein